MQNYSGDAHGIRARVSRLPSWKTSAELQVRDGLLEAGRAEEAIDGHDGPRPSWGEQAIAGPRCGPSTCGASIDNADILLLERESTEEPDCGRIVVANRDLDVGHRVFP